MSVPQKTKHQPKTSTLVYRSNAVHDGCVLAHTSPGGIPSGQAGHVRALTTAPDGSKSLRRGL